MNLPFHIARFAWTKASRKSVAERRAAMKKAARAVKAHELKIKGTLASRSSDLQIIAGALIAGSFLLLSILQFSVQHGWWANMKPEDALPAPTALSALGFLVFCFLALIGKVWRFRESFGGSLLTQMRAYPDKAWTQKDAKLQGALRVATEAYEIERSVQSERRKTCQKLAKKESRIDESNGVSAGTPNFSISLTAKEWTSSQPDPMSPNPSPRQTRRL